MGAFHIGISGWTYPPWRKIFFPEGLPHHNELHFASRQVSSIEINGTFYSLQTHASFQRWYADTPKGFVFSVKAPRFVTHIKRLRAVTAPLANFFASGVLALEEKLGPLLWQLPPSLRYDPETFADFVAALPRSTAEASHAAKKADRIQHPWTKVKGDRPLRHAVEVRNSSFATEEFYAFAREQDLAIVVADTAGKWPLIEELTSDFLYARLHGDEELYVSGYTPEALRRWAQKLRQWQYQGSKRAPAPRNGRDVFVYFDNDVKVRAPFDAMSLAHLLGVGAKPQMPDYSQAELPPARSSARWPAFRRGRKPVDAP